MGDVLEDLTKASLDEIAKHVRPEVAGPDAAVAKGELTPEPPEQVRTSAEARQRGDWLFMFEAARATHLDAGAEDDLVLSFENRKQDGDYLSRLKHVSGDFNRWITRFGSSQSSILRAVFGTVEANYMELSTRSLFLGTYFEIQQHIIAEYGQITSRKPQTVLKRHLCIST